MPTPDFDTPLGPEKLDQIYGDAILEYIRRYNRWVEWVNAGKPGGVARVPEPYDPRTWPEKFHPDVRNRLREFIKSHTRRNQEKEVGEPPTLPWHRNVSLDDFRFDFKEDGTEKELGRGGMGEVYSAHDKVLGRSVAIKLMNKDSLSRPNLVEQFRAEARLQSQLQHNSVPPVYQFGFDEKRGPFIVMQPLSGKPLSSYLPSRE